MADLEAPPSPPPSPPPRYAWIEEDFDRTQRFVIPIIEPPAYQPPAPTTRLCRKETWENIIIIAGLAAFVIVLVMMLLAYT